MTSDEKRAWIMLVTTATAYIVYAVIILGRAGDTPLAQVPYAWTMLATIGGAIVATIVLDILVSMFSPQEGSRQDLRDRQINRFGDYVGQSFVVIGATAALLLALLKADYFWIANVVYLCFVLSSLLGSVAKVVVYRRGLPTW